MVPEDEPLLGGTSPTARLAWLRGALVDNARALVRSNWAKATVLARSFFNPLLFSRPADQAEALARLRANWALYKLFYGAVYALVLVYTILSSPALLLGLAVVAGSWGYMFVLHDAHTVVNLAGYSLGRREKLIVLIPGTLLVITITGALSSLVWVAFSSALVVVPHAVLHNRPELDALDELEIQAAAQSHPQIPAGVA